jgi:hypothetical protein
MAAQNFNHYAAMAKALHEAAVKVVKKSCLDIQRGAQQRAAVDTGFMRSSIYTVTSDGSSYGQSLVGDREQLPEIPAPENDTTGWVAVGATYGAPVEFGSAHGPAQPYLTPATEAARSSFERANEVIQQAYDEVR